MNELEKLNIDLDKLIQDAINKIEELLHANHVKEAEVIAKQLLVVDPENISGMQLYGLLLYRNQKYKQAIEILEKAIGLDNSNCENYNNIALCYLHSGNPTDALVAINTAIQLKPDNHNFVNNKGLIQRAANNLDGAIQTFKNAIELNPKDCKSWENLGSAYGQAKNLDEAINCFHKSIELDPTNLGAHVDLAYGYHLKGEWSLAWKEYEYRLEYWHQIGKNPGKFYEFYKPEKSWNGKDSLEDKIVVVYCEQGSGDMIQFIRFVPELAKLGAKIIIDAPESLAALFDSYGEVRTCYKDTVYDYHCSILSLPYLLNMTTPDCFLSDKPYIFSDKKLDMSDYKDHFKIGIVWAGNPGHPNDINRSCHLSYFREISQIPGVKLFSLQKELGKRVYFNTPGMEIDLASDCEDMRIVDTSQFMTDFKATANIIDSMDLIITVDTSVLHLAGAVGKTTWALIPYNPDWRWTASGETTVWYNSIVLFRQPQYGDWASVFQKVREKLNENIL